MKKSFLLSLKSAFIGGMALFLLYLSGCDITNPLDGIRVILNTKERPTTVSFVFRDSATNEPVGFNSNSQVRITLNGENKDLLIDLLNREIGNIRAEQGFVSFAVRDDIIPSDSNPVQFTLVAEAEGYISTSRQVLVKSRGSNAFEVIMVNRDNLPSGVSGGRTGILGNANAQTGTDSEIIIDGGAIGREMPASVTIAEGTIMRNASGTALSGAVRADIYHFNSTTEGSLQSFPGGFSARVSNFADLASATPNSEKLQNVESDNVFFTTGGFLSLEITAGGEQVSTFDPPLQIDMDMDENVFNASGERATVGSSVPIWSYDRDTGEWSFEEYVEIFETENGTPTLQFEASHLSWWNIDWWGPSCTFGTRVNLLNTNQSFRGMLYRTDVTPHSLLTWTITQPLPGEPNFIEFLFAPTDIPGKLELYNMSDQLVGTVDLPNLCSTTPVDFTVNPDAELTITFRGRGLCANDDDIEVRPNLPVWYRPLSGGTWLQAGNTVNGEITISFPGPAQYLFGTWFENQWYEYQLDLSGFQDGDVFEQEIELPQSVCDDL